MSDKRVPQSTITSKLRGVALFVGALILGWGLPEMIAGQPYAAYLIALGCLAIGLVVVSDDYVQHWLTSIVDSRRLRMTVCAGTCLLLVVGGFIASHTFAIYQQQALEETPFFRGVLRPGTEQSPSYVQDALTNDTVAVMLGDNLTIIQNESKETILTHNGKPLLEIGSLLHN